jgi:hypothetical protein
MKALFLLCMAFFIVPQISQCATKSPEVPARQELTEIMISSWNVGGTWLARFHRDGSATFEFGVNAGDMADAPAGTFSFSEIYSLLVPHLLAAKTGDCLVSLCLPPPAGENLALPLPGHDSLTITMSLEDKAVIRKVLSGARDKTIPFQKERFEKLLKEHPPIPEEGGATQ